MYIIQYVENDENISKLSEHFTMKNIVFTPG